MERRANPVRRSNRHNTAPPMNVPDTKAKIAATTSLEELEAMREGETRKTILDALEQRILELTDGGDTDDEDDEGETQAAPPVVKGKGNNATAQAAARGTRYTVKHPKATGKLGFDGNLYTRTQVSKDQALMEKMYAAGCRAIVKA